MLISDLFLQEIGGKLSYKGRLNMEECQVADIPDGTGTNCVL